MVLRCRHAWKNGYCEHLTCSLTSVLKWIYEVRKTLIIKMQTNIYGILNLSGWKWDCNAQSHPGESGVTHHILFSSWELLKLKTAHRGKEACHPYHFFLFCLCQTWFLFFKTISSSKELTKVVILPISSPTGLWWVTSRRLNSKAASEGSY